MNMSGTKDAWMFTYLNSNSDNHHHQMLLQKQQQSDLRDVGGGAAWWICKNKRHPTAIW